MPDYSSGKFEINKLTSSIFKIKPFEGVDIEHDDVIEMRKVFMQFSGGKKFAVLLDASNPFVPTAEARALLASKEYTQDRIAAAFVTTSLAGKLFGNFFIKVNKPESPTRLFTDEVTAFEWLKQEVTKINI